jgi:hypothetical protein
MRLALHTAPLRRLTCTVANIDQVVNHVLAAIETGPRPVEPWFPVCQNSDQLKHPRRDRFHFVTLQLRDSYPTTESGSMHLKFQSLSIRQH